MSSYSFRHCDAQGYITEHEINNDDFRFKIVPALNGAPNGISFESVNFANYYIAPMPGSPEYGRVGIVENPRNASEASWQATASSKDDGNSVVLSNLGRVGQVLQVGSNLTGACSVNFHPPAVGVFLVDADEQRADATTAWSFGNTTCDILRIFDQSPFGNHLDIGPAGGTVRTPDNPVRADGYPVTVAQHAVYGAYFEGGMGYRRDNTSGVAVGDEPETIYAVWSGAVYNPGCCMDYGNAETDNDADGPGMLSLCVFAFTLRVCV